MVRRFLIACLFLSLSSLAHGQQNWPENRGPNGNYHLTSTTPYPQTWSVITGDNIRWRMPLPETGHSGIAVWEDRLFLTCFRRLTAADQGPRGTWVSESRGYCLDAESGKNLWSCDLPGSRPNQVNGTFTDSTTPTPITDGKHVWFINAGGFMACHTIDGQRIWSKAFEVRTKHSAKQFQPFIHQGDLYYAMMRDAKDPARRPQTAKAWDKNSKTGWPWMHIRKFDALTGKATGVMPDGISVHSKGALGMLNGKRVLLHARGGGHFPPEKPYGISLTSIAPTSSSGLSSSDGDSQLSPAETKQPEPIWTRPDLYFEGTHCVDDKHAYCFGKKDNFFVLDLATGATIKQFPMQGVGSAILYDEATGRYKPPTEVSTLKWKRFLTHRTNMGVGQYHYFMGGVPAMLGRIDCESGDVRYVQVPVQVVASDDAPTGEDGPAKSVEYSWKQFTAGDETGSGFEVQGDRRRLSHGFGHISAATPIVINNHIYFSTVLGTVYVVNAAAEQFDEKAIVAINDLGSPGQTWTLSPFTAANGRLYQRTAREIICIGKP